MHRHPQPVVARKASAYRRNYITRTADPGFVPDEREPTTTGVRAAGYAGKHFETVYEALVAGSSGPLYSQTAKTKVRVIRAISGTGFVLHGPEDNLQLQQLAPGEELVLDGVCQHKIIATGKSDFHVLLIQSAKYEKTLEVVEKEQPPTEIPEALLRPTPPVRRTRSSKVVAQMEKMEQNRQDNAIQAQVAAVPRSPDVFQAGVNPRPSMGNFSDEY